MEEVLQETCRRGIRWKGGVRKGKSRSGGMGEWIPRALEVDRRTTVP